MKVGDLCKVILANTHVETQLDHLVLITKKVGSAYVEGINLKTLRIHHYNKFELEVISESR